MVKLTLEMMFGYVLKWNQNDFDHIWVEQICAAAMLDFFQRGLTFFGQNFKFLKVCI